MKTVRQLVDYLFHSSQEHELDESDRTFLTELNSIEPVKVHEKQPLSRALAKVGLEGLGGKLKTGPNGVYADLDNGEDYGRVVNQFFDEGKLYELASLGWAASFCDDTSSLGDTASFRINFTEIGCSSDGEEVKGHKSEDEDMLASDREALKAFKAVNDLKGRNGSLKPKDDEKVAESRALVESMSNAASIVARLLNRS